MQVKGWPVGTFVRGRRVMWEGEILGAAGRRAGAVSGGLRLHYPTSPTPSPFAPKDCSGCMLGSRTFYLPGLAALNDGATFAIPGREALSLQREREKK